MVLPYVYRLTSVKSPRGLPWQDRLHRVTGRTIGIFHSGSVASSALIPFTPPMFSQPGLSCRLD